MCKVQAAVAGALAVALAGGVASAQSNQQPATQGAPKRYKAQPLNLRKEQLGTQAYANAGRARMRAGDCEGALESFDAALRTTTEDPTLFRDRGLCHEKLGHPYPAIDDYRAYLTNAPDAADADGIRQRLNRLEEETTGRAPAAAANDDTNVPSANGGAPAEGTSGQTPAKTQDTADLDEDDVLDSPLRHGKGFALAPWFSLHKWVFQNTSFGDAQTWSESVGGQFRYSFGPVASLVVEVGYEHFNSTTDDADVIHGFTSLLGLELRFPLDVRYDNQVFFQPAVGFEHLQFVPSDSAFQALNVNGLVPRLRFGYRHMVGDSTSLDVSLDAGFAKWWATDGAQAPDTTLMVALNVGVVWGL
jgi:tetratricopeptide (TPR) repeat protein